MISNSVPGRMATALAICLFGNVLPCVTALADGGFTTVALSDFSRIQPYTFQSPEINNLGQVAYTGGAPTFDDLYLYKPGDGNSILAKRTDSAPGTIGETFDTVWGQRLTESGQVSFKGILAGDDAAPDDRFGIWSQGSGGNFNLIGRSATQAPGTPAGTLLKRAGDFKFSTSGRITFASRLQNGVDQSTDRGIWTAHDGGPVQLIARNGDPVPNAAAGVVFRNLSSNFFQNDNGQVLFAANTSGLSTDSTHFVWDSVSGYNKIAESRTDIPGNPSIRFNRPFAEGFNNAGDVAFFDLGTSRDRVIVRTASGQVRLVAEEKTPAPGTPAGVAFNQINENFVLNSRGHVAAWANLMGTGVNAGNDEGIWSESQSGLQMVVRKGDPVPGVPADVRFAHLGAPTMNANGQVVFPANLIGNGINSTNDFGFWGQRLDGSLQLLVREGDQIDVDDGPATDLRTVRQLDEIFKFSGNEDGRPSVFNDGGEFVFTAHFSSGSYGVFTSRAIAVPEPTFPMMVCALVAITSMSRSVPRVLLGNDPSSGRTPV
jgi:hypothetical protein